MHACRLTIDGRGPAHNRRTRTVLVSVKERGWWWVPKANAPDDAQRRVGLRAREKQASQLNA
eukprot:5970984-Prymnesium_polylepis.1